MFLNSKEWRQFQESVGRKTFSIGEGFLVRLDIPFGKNYLYSNYVDIPKHLKEVKSIAKGEGAIFFKWEPLMRRDLEVQAELEGNLASWGFQKARKELQPQRTTILDLTKDKEEILAGMHKKTRYNIRLAGRRGVKIAESEDFESFWKLMRKTAQRDKFHTHSKDYYEKLLGLNMAKLYFAKKEDKLHAAAITLFYKGRATYLHGASDYKYRRDMAPHLLHWQIILDAKEQGLKEYDLWGIDEKKWPGVTRFKRGFEGEEVEYIGSWDIPLQKFWYNLYKLKNEF
ncbi:MAG: peptidoglycan bridge formation glycyltransferase FemA/FemB family protein [Candidatus Spechtbacterales bacterium]|nr:peptidoglycan bridge formation glycyltransferase FemA/FemB family protein [Candidatus Spechtbacterales bacterium]